MSACPRCGCHGALVAPRVLCLHVLCPCYHKPSRLLYQDAFMRGDTTFSGDDMLSVRLDLWKAESRAQEADQA